MRVNQLTNLQIDEEAIGLLKALEPNGGYFFGNSSGMDSGICESLLNRAGVRYDAHYNVSPVDPYQHLATTSQKQLPQFNHSYQHTDHSPLHGELITQTGERQFSAILVRHRGIYSYSLNQPPEEHLTTLTGVWYSTPRCTPHDALSAGRADYASLD